MGGKGRRRREKNYLATHGGPTRIPLSPGPSQVDALPSELRKLISFTSTLHGSNKVANNDEHEKTNTKGDADARKALKTDASKERLRLQAIKAYRNRRGRTSRPGLQLPPVFTSPSVENDEISP